MRGESYKPLEQQKKLNSDNVNVSKISEPYVLSNSRWEWKTYKNYLTISILYVYPSELKTNIHTTLVQDYIQQLYAWYLKLEINKMVHIMWIYKQTMIYPFNELLLSHIKVTIYWNIQKYGWISKKFLFLDEKKLHTNARHERVLSLWFHLY